MSDTYTSFALVGVGRFFGRPLIKCLLERNASVIVLTRPSSIKTVPDGVKVVAVNYSDVETVANVLREHSVDVFISTLCDSREGLASQFPLVDAAKAAGVKLFVPSEFGMPSNDINDDSAWGLKNRVAVHAKTIGLPTLRAFVGGIHEGIPWVSGIKSTGKFLIVGKGETPISFTALSDIAAYLAYILTTLPPAQLHDRILRIEGDRATLREIAALYEGKVPVEFVDSIPGDTAFAKLCEEVFKRFELEQGVQVGIMQRTRRGLSLLERPINYTLGSSGKV